MHLHDDRRPSATPSTAHSAAQTICGDGSQESLPKLDKDSSDSPSQPFWSLALWRGVFANIVTWTRAPRSRFDTIDPSHAQYVLLFFFFIDGILDAVTVSSYKLVFVSNMTGNVVTLAVSLYTSTVGNTPAHVIALAGYCIGGYVVGQWGHGWHHVKSRVHIEAFYYWLIDWPLYLLKGLTGIGPGVRRLGGQWSDPPSIPGLARRRDFLIYMTMAQALLAVMGALLALYNASYLAILVPLSGLAGAQAGVARQSEVPELGTTTVVTSLLTDLFIDKDIWKWGNRSRNRRVAGALALFAGSLVGIRMKELMPPYAIMLVVFAMKVFCAVWWLVASGKSTDGSIHDTQA